MITFNNVLLGSISLSTLNILADNTFVPTLKSVFEFWIIFTLLFSGLGQNTLKCNQLVNTNYTALYLIISNWITKKKKVFYSE